MVVFSPFALASAVGTPNASCGDFTITFVAPDKTAVLAPQLMTAYAFADAKDVEKQLQIWQKEWDAAGATERELHQTLVEKYRAVVQAARTFIKQHQQHAAQRKQDIILSAQQAVASDAAAHDVGRQLKQLQQVWKATGYAGKKAEQDLWQQFRQVCDGFFAKREADKQQWQQQHQ